MRRAMERIFKLVGVPAPLAVTRKFLLERMPTTGSLLPPLRAVAAHHPPRHTT